MKASISTDLKARAVPVYCRASTVVELLASTTPSMLSRSTNAKEEEAKENNLTREVGTLTQVSPIRINLFLLKIKESIYSKTH